MCINTKYMYFGVGVVDNYRKNPQEAGKKATIEAIENCPVERSRFATTQFMRGTKKGFTDIVKNPPYFILSFVSGTKYIKGKPLPGRETEFLNGVLNAAGSHIPIVGASASSDFDKLTKGIAENYQFANGDIYSGAALVTFVVSDLYFSYGLEHGYKSTPRIVLLSKLGGDGRIIEKLNGKNAVGEYCRILGVATKEFLSNPWKYTFANPLATMDFDGNIYLRTIVSNPDKKTFSTIPKLVENSFADIALGEPNKIVSALSDTLLQAKQRHEAKKVAVAFVFSCSTRRVILGKNLEKTFDLMKSQHSNINLFGFYTFGEIGAKSDRFPQFNNQTVTSLIIFDKLLTE